ncbi:hypothetical protein [Isoptericola aurantiacus]|uniref:hypothetical protein n=1 Tax=Isoptericola aurantiacus TaxID=3377839 RepID=UPI00383AEBD9
MISVHPKGAAAVLEKVLTDASVGTGVFYDRAGRPMAASKQVSDPEYSDRYVAQTRALLETLDTEASAPPA